MNEVSSLVSMISQVGFPIVIAVFVLWRLNGRLEKLLILAEKLDRNTDTQERMIDTQDSVREELRNLRETLRQRY